MKRCREKEATENMDITERSRAQSCVLAIFTGLEPSRRTGTLPVYAPYNQPWKEMSNYSW